MLEIGTGTGYSGALLAALVGPGGTVTSIDVSEHLVACANRLHRERGITGVVCHVADGLAGYPRHGPYDRIVAWCTFPYVPQAWFDQLAPTGRIVACLPILAQPSTTLVATVSVASGEPWVESVSFGGYAQSTSAAVDDVLTVPGRWVDWSTSGPAPSWISIGWGGSDDLLRTGARETLNRLLNPGHTETYGCVDPDWQSWNIYSAVTGGPQRSVVSLCARARGIGHTTPTSAAVILMDGTIIADRAGSPSLTALKAWLERWEDAGRPDASRYEATLVPQGGAQPTGWDLRPHLPYL